MTVTVSLSLPLPPAPLHVKVKILVTARGPVLSLLPLVPLTPFHAPLAVHAVAFVDVQLRLELPPAEMVLGFTVKVTVGAGGGGGGGDAVATTVAD